MILGDDRADLFIAVVPVLNQHQTTESLMESWFELSKSRIRVLFIDNGSDEPLAEQKFIRRWSADHDIRVHRNNENVGVYPTFQQGLELTGNSTFIFYSHNDLEMIEVGWDEKMNNILAELMWRQLNPGVCGMFGARQIGNSDIYQTPYHFTQLRRWDCVTVPSMVHSDRMLMSNYERVAVLDGFSLIVRRQMIREVMNGRFDHANFPPHHMYDQDICVTSHYGGFKNFAIDVDCRHHSGVTSCREKWAEAMSTTDQEVHLEAHRVFYDKWRGKLPVCV